MDNIKIGSLNTRGLGDLNKRRRVFNYLRQQQYDIICLQETHSTPEQEELWKKQWNGPIHFSHGTSQARGVCILFSQSIKNCNVKFGDADGHLLILEVEIKQMQLAVCNVYAPNTDVPDFFVKMFTELDKCDFQDRITIGDYNLVLNLDLDRKGSNHNHKKACETVTNAMDTYKMNDIWRTLHPDKKTYSWHKTKPRPHFARLDFALISDMLTSRIIKSNYTYGYNSDHSLVELIISTNESKRGRGFWKMNAKLLTQPNYEKGVIEAIKEGRKQV